MTRGQIILLGGSLLAACRASSPAPASGAAAAPTEASDDRGVPSEQTTTLKAGDPAPEFSLVAPDGTEVSSAAKLAEGPLVVVFYRGDW